jgi:HTH-type transcriptional regulator/antitoxin HipB
MQPALSSSRCARRNAGLTQAELGKRIGLRQATISKLEKGEPATQPATLLDVLTALGLEITIGERSKGPVRNLEEMF